MRLIAVAALSLFLAACTVPTSTPHAAADPEAAPAKMQVQLLGTWAWQSTIARTASYKAAEPARYQVAFQSDGYALVHADCNRGRANFQLKGVSLTFGPIGLSKMGCAADSQDRQFLADLSAAQSVAVDADHLQINLADDRGVMHLVRTPAAGL